MKYTKLFNNHSEYEEYMASDNAALPNLSWCIQEDEGHFTPYVIETKLVAKFNVTSTSEPTQIMSSIRYAYIYISSMEIDGVVQPSITSAYTFDTLGEHTVKYTLVDDTTGRVLVGCSNITDITIPNSVTTIGNMAFNGCTSLTSVTIPNSVTSIEDSAFEHCSSLTSIDIPDSVASIGRYAFDMCTGLTSIDIPSGVTTIGYYVFSNCTSLSSITVDSNNSTFDSRNNCNGIIETATNTLVAGCKNTIIPSTVTSIGDYAFAVCTNLTSITIPDSVTSIGNGAFMYCSGLTSIDIPSGVTSIGYNVFQDCSDLSSITVDSDNATFDSRNNCNAVIETSTNELVVGCKDTIIPNTVTSIGDYAFVNCNFSAITIPNSVTSIGDSAFSYCSGLTSIVIPNSVTSIGDSAFRHCENIESIEIPDSVTSIGDGAFQYSSGLTEVLIGTGITSIGEYAFDECEKLEKLTILAATPPDFGYAAFAGYKLVIYVPDDYVETYKTAPRWSYYSDRIQGLGCTPGHVYTLLGEPSYPSTVAASATSFELSFSYNDTYTSTTCDEGSFMDGDTVEIQISENLSTSARTISDTYVFNGSMNVPYSLTQEGREELPYNQQYLTFEILTGGTILWKAATTAVTRTISYSINGGEWTEITSSTGGTEINVSANDKVRFKGTNTAYATAKDVVSTFSGSTAVFDVYGNAMSLIGGDDFSGLTSFTTDWAFHDLFNTTNVVSAKNLILPVTTLRSCCYRAMFAHAKKLTEAPELPATTLAASGYSYMFQDCTALQKAPDLLAETIVGGCYIGMFNSASTLNYIKCTATNGVTTGNTKSWTDAVSNTGTFIRAANVNWTRGGSGVPTNWELYNDTSVEVPVISFNGFETITLSCETEGADILYKLNDTGEYSVYTTPIIISEDTFIEAYSTYSGETSRPVSQTCQYVSTVPIEYSNRDLKKWQYGGQEITTPYSINAIDGHSSSYAKGTFTFETSFALKEAEPTYLWFQHADQSASIYVDDTLVEKHWGGYAAFTSDISEYVHSGINNIKVAIKNNEGNNLAPASADFNFNATLGNVRLLTSPYVPAMEYGYDGFHITSTVSDAEATMNIKTSVPTGATLVCKIDDGNTNIYSATSASTGEEMTFTKVITNPHLWNGKSDPYMYTVTLEIYEGNDIYHRFVRPYGLRYYEYVINDTEKVGTVSEPYTGFLLNGSPYLLRGVCMHDDIDGKANALDETDYDNTFATIQELGCNFLRLAHYPHPKEVYDRCDRLGIVVQTEGPCVNKLQSTMPEDYYTHLTGQYTDMVNQHYNHPCIFFWGLSNETSTDDKNFGKQKVEEYTALIKNLDSERMVGYVLAQGNGTSPSAYYNDPSNVDWFGCNIYVGWYDSPNSNTPVSQINTRLANTIGRVSKPMAYSEYGCGGTSTCHSDDFMNTTTRGNNPRHDIEYMMWLHEGHIATIKQYPQLLYTSQWQLFDIAVSSRNEGYTECLDGVSTSINDNLRRLNNKGLVERDHVTKKDTFYLYKAWWNTTDKFVHICGKNYTKTTSRVIKCYTNDGNSLTLYVNGTSAETVTVTDNIATFTARNFNDGDAVMVSGATSNDSFTFVSHDYVEIAGTKWATMNVGATGVTDYGLLFQWGDIQGYTASQVGRGTGKKYFGWTDYKYCSGAGTSESAMTKYNSTDNKKVLEISDDAANASWGGNWRMPTKAEFETLLNSVDTAETADYQGSGVAGMICTDKTDSSKVLFFPAAGYADQGRTYAVGASPRYWSSSHYVNDDGYANRLIEGDVGTNARFVGYSIRPVKNV